MLVPEVAMLTCSLYVPALILTVAPAWTVLAAFWIVFQGLADVPVPVVSLPSSYIIGAAGGCGVIVSGGDSALDGPGAAIGIGVVDSNIVAGVGNDAVNNSPPLVLVGIGNSAGAVGS